MEGQSIYGDPVDIIDYGETQIPKDVFEDYIQGMQQVWTSDKYHLLSNNCNHFSNEVIQFLVGQNIPSHISDLPNDFAKTSLGQQLLPMIEGMYGTPPAGNLGQSLPTAAAASTSTHTSTPSTVPTFSSGYTDNQNKGSKYLKSIQVSSVKELQDGILKNNPAVVIYFTSATCPPCRVIAPHFETMLNEVNSDSLRAQRNEYIVGVKVDCSVQFQIGSHYNVSATPTFMFFKNGEKTSQFSGANYQELKSEIDLLMFVAYPKHPHINLSLPTMMSLASRPITFSGNPATKVEAIGKKLAQFLSDSELSGQPLKQLIDSLSILLKSPSTSIAKANINSATVPTLGKAK
ncbi:hypothetical protein H4219_004598 [Mycoemilia scoparia]|uniref:Thioredoxin domain-containing protein n=1 Tax=Mycoemilia scoparia TaxID=417184 RepID=A0A9W7ZWY3_9FUNG|nr:hypothetical protein H4219_004598 [Mycoemilia scoparia]